MASFTNQATLTYTGGSTLSNIVTGEILETLAVTKTAAGDTFSAGDAVTYAIALTNSGSSPLTGITLTDDLGAYPFDTTTLVPLTYVNGSLLYYVNGSLQPTPAVTAGTDLVITGISVPAGGDALIVYRATANEFAPIAAGGTIQNTVTVTGGGLTEPLTAEETVTAAESTSLAITKDLSPTTVPENGTITYTLTVVNSGNIPADAADGLSVSDTFLPALSDITVTLDGTPLVLGTDYTYDEGTGLFTTTPGRITVPAATLTQDPATGVYTAVPGTATLTVTGTV